MRISNVLEPVNCVVRPRSVPEPGFDARVGVEPPGLCTWAVRLRSSTPLIGAARQASAHSCFAFASLLLLLRVCVGREMAEDSAY